VLCSTQEQANRLSIPAPSRATIALHPYIHSCQKHGHSNHGRLSICYSLETVFVPPIPFLHHLYAEVNSPPLVAESLIRISAELRCGILRYFSVHYKSVKPRLNLSHPTPLGTLLSFNISSFKHYESPVRHDYIAGVYP
jgi:hypothetical protein